MPNMKALITGIGGQDGFFLCRLLRGKRYDVVGVLPAEDFSAETVRLLRGPNVRLVEGGIDDKDLLRDLIKDLQPDHIYNLAGVSFVPQSWEAPDEAVRINGAAVGGLLALVRDESPSSRVFQAGSSEMFGHSPPSCPQDESTPFRPDNPYGASKTVAAHLVRNFRERYGLFACTGILYNHESEWRGERFVTRKISLGAAAAKLGLSDTLSLGDIDAVRDWSYAGDFVEAMWRVLSADLPADYVFASGSLHSVRDALRIAFEHVGLNWEDHVDYDASLIRPREAVPLCGNPALLRKDLNWAPSVGFEDLIRLMVDKDLERLGGMASGAGEVAPD